MTTVPAPQDPNPNWTIWHALATLLLILGAVAVVVIDPNVLGG